MSETMSAPPLTDAPAKRTPTVYFIDDSATMREVIKIAFRKESINVITCADANAALAQFEQNPPDAVITDVIMPDQDGYSVCTQIKQHAEYGSVPVILMSGVVNKTVADKAIAVKADELIRKPFQPQELIGRVKTLLGAKIAPPPVVERPAAGTGASSLSSLFTPPAPPAATQAPPPSGLTPADQRIADSIWPRALADALAPRPAAPLAPPAPVAPSFQTPTFQPQAPGFQPQGPASFLEPSPQAPSFNASAPHLVSRGAGGADLTKLRAEISRLELLVKKLQTELQIERQYNQALEQHLHNLTTSE
jgi:twitching motility two-component system response regulator PilH